jgi:hypothetical protein
MTFIVLLNLRFSNLVYSFFLYAVLAKAGGKDIHYYLKGKVVAIEEDCFLPCLPPAKAGGNLSIDYSF